jgi:hypothetical protein
MKHAPVAIDFGLLLSASAACPKPICCPYCPAEFPLHWTHSGSYTRYAGDLDDPCKRVAVPRYWCPIAGRTFSLPPDSLLPFCRSNAGLVLQWLHALLIEGVAVNTLARKAGVTRGLLRDLKARCLRTLPKLRLPWHEGALNAARFLTMLVQPATAVAELFRGWKQCEPKLSIVGIYSR